MRQIYSPLDGFRSPFGRLMGSTAPFTPAVLFGASEPGVWYDPSDLTTLFQDTAGTTPVTTPGQTVALALDKSKGLVLGSELVTNGDFSSGTGWSTGGGWTISSGAASIASSGNLTQNALALLAQNKLVKVTYTITSAFSGSGVAPFFQQTSPTSINVFGTYRTAVGTYTEYLQAPLNATVFGFNSGSTSGSIDNISVKELPGFHATQATLASRPTYGIVPLGGRRNLLTRTEEFENAAWAKINATVTANAAVAPDGTATADLLTSSGGETRVGLNPGILAGSTSYVASMYGKFSNANGRYLWFRDFYAGRDAGFDLQNGVVTQVSAGMTASVVALPNGWYRCVAAWTTPTTPAVANQQHWVQSASGTNVSSGTSGGQFFIWGAQLETGSTATAYQRVTTSFDVTEAGVASLSYLSFDGVDDFMVTPTITPGIDKAQVFAGVRKLSDVAFAMVAETGTGLQNGSIFLAAPGGAAANYRLLSRGTTNGDAIGTTFAAPITNVLTGLGDIGGDLATLRVNGTQAAQSTADQGAGNYLAYPIYIGRRGGTSNPFNGQIYSLIVRFGTNLDAGTITSTETWVNGKTGAYT